MNLGNDGSVVMKYDFSRLKMNDIVRRNHCPRQFEFDYGGGETWYEAMKRKQTVWADREFALRTEYLKKDCSSEDKPVLRLVSSIKRNIGAQSKFSFASTSADTKADFSETD